MHRRRSFLRSDCASRFMRRASQHQQKRVPPVPKSLTIPPFVRKSHPALTSAGVMNLVQMSRSLRDFLLIAISVADVKDGARTKRIVTIFTVSVLSSRLTSMALTRNFRAVSNKRAAVPAPRLEAFRHSEERRSRSYGGHYCLAVHVWYAPQQRWSRTAHRSGRHATFEYRPDDERLH